MKVKHVNYKRLLHSFRSGGLIFVQNFYNGDKGKSRSETVEGLDRYEYSVITGRLVESAGAVCRIMSPS